MTLRPPRSTRTDTLFPYTTRFRSGSTHMIRRSHLSGKVTEETEFFGKQHDKLVILGAATARTEMAGAEQKEESKAAETDYGAVAIEPVIKHTSKPTQAAALITLDEDDPEFDSDEDPDADLDL